MNVAEAKEMAQVAHEVGTPLHSASGHVELLRQDLGATAKQEPMARRLAREEGIFAGTSSGANVVGALRLAERLPLGSVVVTLAVDSGFKYMMGPPFGV